MDACAARPVLFCMVPEYGHLVPCFKIARDLAATASCCFLSLTEATDEIVRGAGFQFQPLCRELFSRSHDWRRCLDELAYDGTLEAELKLRNPGAVVVDTLL